MEGRKSGLNKNHGEKESARKLAVFSFNCLRILVFSRCFILFLLFSCHETDGKTTIHKSHSKLPELAGLDGSIAPYMSRLCEQRMVSRWVFLDKRNGF